MRKIILSKDGQDSECDAARREETKFGRMRNMKAPATGRAKKTKKATRSLRNGRRVTARGKQLPLIVEKGEDGYYVVECPLLQGCYTQGKTLDEALRNIREVIELLLEEKEARTTLEEYRPTEISFHTITL